MAQVDAVIFSSGMNGNGTVTVYADNTNNESVTYDSLYIAEGASLSYFNAADFVGGLTSPPATSVPLLVGSSGTFPANSGPIALATFMPSASTAYDGGYITFSGEPAP